VLDITAVIIKQAFYLSLEVYLKRNSKHSVCQDQIFFLMWAK